MGSNIDPTVWGGVMKAKNANCERGLKSNIYIFCTHLTDSHGTQETPGIMNICKGTRPRCRSTPKSRFECRSGGPPLEGVKNIGAWRYMSVKQGSITSERLLTALDRNWGISPQRVHICRGRRGRRGRAGGMRIPHKYAP